MEKETLEEAAERFLKDGARKFKTAKQVLIGFAKWQAERMYSEEDLVRFMQFIISQESLQNTSSVSKTTVMYYIEQFKKK